jgi:hypothetical protein
MDNLFSFDFDYLDVPAPSAPTTQMNDLFSFDFNSLDVPAPSAPTFQMDNLFSFDFGSLDVPAPSTPTFFMDGFCDARGPSAPALPIIGFRDVRGPSAPALPIIGFRDVRGPSASNMRFILPFEYEVEQSDIRISRNSTLLNRDNTPERRDIKLPTLLTIPISALTLMSTEFMQNVAASAPAKHVNGLNQEEVKALDISEAGAYACAIRGNVLFDIRTPTIINQIIDLSLQFARVSSSSISYETIRRLTRLRATKLRTCIRGITAELTRKFSEAQASLALVSASWMLDAAQPEWSQLTLVKATVDELAAKAVGKRLPSLFSQSASNGLVAYVLFSVRLFNKFSVITLITFF